MVFFKLAARFILISALVLGLVELGYSQCSSLPPVNRASSASQDKFCSPVLATIQYGIGFGSINLPAGPTYDLIFFWGDGTSDPPVVIAPGSSSYNFTRTHSYPVDSDCEYRVRIVMRVNGEFCLNTEQIQFVSTWRTDEFNNGNVQLISPLTGTSLHEVCEGDNISVFFEDDTQFNCNQAYIANYPPNDVIKQPNQQYRWQQIVYNTPIGGNKIPNVSVNGLMVTDPSGADISLNYQDPRGVVFLPPLVNPGNGRDALLISAPGGSGPGSPQVGDEFEVTIRYWNICNPYDDDFSNGNLTPTSGNINDGDNPPVERTAIIRIIDAPAQPIVDDLEICFGDLATATLTVNNVQGGVTYRWYPTLADAQANTNVINTSDTFTPTAAQAPAGVNDYFVTATAGTSCVSLPEEVILIRRTDISPAPTGIMGDANVCPNGIEIYSFATDPAIAAVGGATEYIWTIPPGWTLNSGQGTKSISVLTNGTLGSTTLSVVRRFVTATTNGSHCESNPNPFPITVRANPTASPLTPFDVCEGTAQAIDGNPVNPFGTITIHSWTGNTSILNATNIQVPNTIVTAVPGSYNLTYSITNSIGCSGSAPVVINISAKPTTATTTTPQQLLCSTLVSNPLGGNTPLVGTGTWTLISKPSGSVATNTGFSNQTNPNATFTGDRFGQYVLRWTIVNGSCPSFAEELINFGTDPGPQDAGPANAFCGSVGSLNAVAPTIGSGTWTQVAGPLANNTLFTDVTSRTSGISLINTTASAIGDYTYRWSVTSGSCLPPGTDDVVITFNSPVVANTLIETVCETTVGTGISVGADLTLYHDDITGIAGSVNRSVEWFTSATRSPATKVATPTSFNITNGTLYTRVTNTLTLPFCTQDARVDFSVNPLPAFPGVIGVSQSVCDGSDPSSFNELASPIGGIGPYTYQWQQSIDNITFADVSGGTAVAFDPPVVPVTTYYKRLVSASACPGLESNVVKVTLNPLPTGTVSAPRPRICEDEFFILSFDFTGTAPFYFDYNDGTTFVNNRIGANNTPVPIFDFNTSTTYTLTRLVDFNGCVAVFPPNPSTTVDVVKINTDFTFTPSSQCSGVPISFQWTVDTNVEYTWIWNDGTPNSVVAQNSLPTGLQSIPHAFTSANASGDTNIPVILSATNNVDGCGPKVSTETITVFPTILINVFPDKNVICSGETVKFTNATKGGTNHRWYYREKGTTSPIFDERNLVAGTTQDFVFTNTTTKNPIVYEMVYEVKNANCSDFATYDITVYREVVALFDEGVVPPLIGGSSTVSFSNTSNPVDASDFEYHWEFGIGATPTTLNTAALINPIQYNSAGQKTVILTAVNIDARAAGIATGCPSIFTKTIDILLLPLMADFKYTPQATCFPADIVVTENLSTGDVYEWKLFSTTSGVPLIISNEILPTFKIANPGSYFIELKTSSSVSGNPPAFKDNSAKPIELFDLPVAAFEMRPSSVYVPDEEVMLTNRSTEASPDLFSWDFGDGETSTDLEPKHAYVVAGKYTITLEAGFNHGDKDFDGDGITDGELICYDTTSQKIMAKEGGLSRIPNAFTPSTSGPNGGVSGGGTFNDVFKPITKGVEEFEMDIFDRWGNLIFQSKNKDVGWDGYDQNGVLMPGGVYVYKLTMRLSNNQRTTQLGDVTLIR
jgi:gliding motility-associated-like protein